MTYRCSAIRLGDFCDEPGDYIVSRRYVADRTMSFAYCRPHALEILMGAFQGLLRHAVAVESIRGTQ